MAPKAALRHRDLTGVAEQQVQREREGRVDEDLVEVVQPDLHDRLLDPGQLGPQPTPSDRCSEATATMRYTTSTTKTAVCVHRTDSQIDEYCSIRATAMPVDEDPDR